MLDVLAALAREQERDVAGLRAGLEVAARRPATTASAGSRVDERRPPDRASRAGLRVGGHERQARGLEASNARLRAMRDEGERRVVLQPLAPLVAFVHDALRVAADSTTSSLGTARTRCARGAGPVYSSSATWKLLPPKPKRAHRGAARMRVAADPRPGLRVQVERASARVELRVRLRHLDRRRQHLVVQRQDRLDQAGRAGRRLGVADLRLHRAERAPLRGPRGPCASNTAVSASNSAASPTFVPVPCASTSSTVSGP